MKNGFELVTVTLLVVLLGLTSTKAQAHYLSVANASATCQGYTLTVTGSSLDKGTKYQIQYSFDANGEEIASGAIPFTANGSSVTKTVSGNWGVVSGATITGSATLIGPDTNSTDIIVSPAPVTCGTTPPPVCTAPIPGDTISNTSWNSFNAPNGAVVWVHAHIGKPSGLPTDTTTAVSFSNVSLTLNGKTYPLPNGQMIFDSSTSGKTTFLPANSNTPPQWVTEVNLNNLSEEIFFTGLAIPVTDDLKKGGKATITFTATSSPAITFPWQWSAAVYTYWPSDWNMAAVRWYHSSYHAGTPTNNDVQKSLIQGPRGGGGSNYTGSWSATGSGGTCPPTQQTDPFEPQ